MHRLTLQSPSPEDTMMIAKMLSKHLKAGDIVCLFGDLGAGKTTFVKGLAEALRVNPVDVHSPTFMIMNTYEEGALPIYHFDCYRIEGLDLLTIGYEEFFYGQGVAVIEWAERLGDLLPKEYIKIELKHHSYDQRQIKLSAHGKKYDERWDVLISRIQH